MKWYSILIVITAVFICSNIPKPTNELYNLNHTRNKENFYLPTNCDFYPESYPLISQAIFENIPSPFDNVARENLYLAIDEYTDSRWINGHGWYSEDNYDENLAQEFKCANQKRFKLEDNFSFSIPYSIMTKQEQHEIWKKTHVSSGWNLFKDKYGEHAMVVNVSNVGYNLARDKAVIYIGYLFGDLGGEGFYVLYKFADKKWIRIECRSLWMS
jgi:hypothetical protein